MHFLSIMLIALAGVAVAALLYGLVIERRRARIRERNKRAFERINTPPPIRTNARFDDGR
jgi:Flp pilus assembly protein TadB